MNWVYIDVDVGVDVDMAVAMNWSSFNGALGSLSYYGPHKAVSMFFWGVSI